jgi:hypothetical protein
MLDVHSCLLCLGPADSGIELGQEVFGQFDGWPVKLDLSLPKPDHPRKIRQGQLHAVQVHD